MGELTAKQERFVAEYLLDLNGKQAAIRAGYSERTAEVQASKLLSNPKVRAAVMAAKTERAETTKVDANWLLTRLAQEADADIADLYNDAGELKAVKDWPEIWRKGLVAGVDIETVPGGTGKVTKIKVSDRVRRLELIGKHIDVQAFKERVEVEAGPSLAATIAEARRRVTERGR